MIPLEFQKWINGGLQQFFSSKFTQFSKDDSRIPELISQIADVTLRGGDRLRPYFCYLGYLAAGKKRKQDILPILLALETFHTFALIHDDIMDGAELRRGGFTIHAYFTQNLRNSQLATSLAILAGDLCLVWAQELFDKLSSRTRFGISAIEKRMLKLVQHDKVIQTARQVFNDLREEVISGQISDVWGMRGSSPASIRAMYGRKTGNYTVTKPLVLGALLGGGSHKLVERLTKYGKAVGLAFQLKDDILGVFGDETVTGKSTLQDLEEGKWTLMVAETYRRASEKEKQLLLRYLDNRESTAKELEWVKRQIEVSGAKVEMEREMVQLINKAMMHIEPIVNESKHSLERIARFTIERKI